MSFLPEAPSNSDRDYRPTRRSSLGRRIRGRKRRNQDATRRPAPTKNPVMIKYQSMEGQVQRSPCRHDCQENHEAPSTATPERSRTTMPTLAFRATCDPRAISRVPGPMGVGTLGFEPRSAGFHQAGSDPARFSEFGSSLQSVITESANPLSVKPVTGARQSTRLAYVPLPTAENAGSYVVFLPRSVRTSPRRARPRGLRPAAGPWSCRIGSRVSSGTVYPAGPRGPSPPPRSPSSRGGRRGRPSRVP